MTEHGAVLKDGVQVADIRHCCHCGLHWEVKQGSGIRRAFCLKCGDITCGSALCLKYHVPFEARLDAFEGRKTAYDDVIHELVAEGGTLIS